MTEGQYRSFVSFQKFLLDRHINTKLDELAVHAGMEPGEWKRKNDPWAKILVYVNEFTKSMSEGFRSMNKLRLGMGLPEFKEKEDAEDSNSVQA